MTSVSPACNGFLRLTSGAIPAELLAASMATEPIDPLVIDTFLFIQDSTVALQSYQSLGNKPGLETGLRGQNKVSALAKDLAIKFSGDSAPPPAKKEAVENKVTEVEKVCTSTHVPNWM